MDNIFPSPREAKDFMQNPGSSENAFKNTVTVAILSGVGAGRKGTSIDISAQTVDSIRVVLQKLNQLGYKAQIVGGKKLEVSWE